MGAADPLPLPPFSTTTATAIRGRSAGAKARKSPMIPEVRRYLVLFVVLVLSDSDHLSGAGLAGHSIGGAGAHPPGGAAGAVNDILHGPDHAGPVLLLGDLDGARYFRNQDVAPVLSTRLLPQNHLRAQPHSTRPEGRRRRGELQRSGQHVSLADAGNQGFPPDTRADRGPLPSRRAKARGPTIRPAGRPPWRLPNPKSVNVPYMRSIPRSSASR